MVGESLPLLRQPLRIVLGITDPVARMREDPGLGGRLENPGMGPEARLRHGGEQNTLDELGVLLGQPPLAHENVVEVRAHGLRLTVDAGLERLEAVERLGDEPGITVLDVLEEDRVAVRKESFLVVRALLDRDAEDVVVLSQLLFDRVREGERALPARPAGPGRDPPLRRFILRRVLDRLCGFAQLRSGPRRGSAGRHRLRHRSGRRLGRRGPSRRLRRLRSRLGRPFRDRRGRDADYELAARRRDRKRPAEELRHGVLEGGELLVVERLAPFDHREQGGERGRAFEERWGVLAVECLGVKGGLADLPRLRLALDERAEVRTVDVGDGQDAVEHRHHPGARFGQGRLLLLNGERLHHRLEHGAERLEAVDL